MKFFNEIKESKTQKVVKIRTPFVKKLPKKMPIEKPNKGKKIIVINILNYFIIKKLFFFFFGYHFSGS